MHKGGCGGSLWSCALVDICPLLAPPVRVAFGGSMSRPWSSLMSTSVKLWIDPGGGCCQSLKSDGRRTNACLRLILQNTVRSNMPTVTPVRAKERVAHLLAFNTPATRKTDAPTTLHLTGAHRPNGLPAPSCSRTCTAARPTLPQDCHQYDHIGRVRGHTRTMRCYFLPLPLPLVAEAAASFSFLASSFCFCLKAMSSCNGTRGPDNKGRQTQ